MALRCHGNGAPTKWRRRDVYALCVVLAWAALAWRQAGARGARWTVKRPRYPSSGHRLVRQPDVTIDGHVFLLTQCARACWTHARCRSYNFNARRRRCEMNHVTHVEVPSLLRPLAGYTYHTRATLSLDKADTLPGQPDCQHGGAAVYTRWASGHWLARCVCPQPWTGPSCETDGGVAEWTSWSMWQPCRSTCGGGWQTRRRECTIETDDDDGGDDDVLRSTVACVGPSVVYRRCNMHQCPHWAEWSAWTSCSTAVTCGRGARTRSRVCESAGCTPGRANESRVCHSPLCDAPVRLSGSIVDGEGDLELYDTVRSRWAYVCHTGWNLQAAHVACRQLGFTQADAVAPGTRNGDPSVVYVVKDFSCNGSELSLVSCDHAPWSAEWSCDGNAAVVCAYVAAKFSDWSDWSECNSTCGGGIRRRERTCEESTSGATSCRGESEERNDCNQLPCPVDGYFESWSDWSSCDVTCGTGNQSRHRACIEPLFGGEPCYGESTEARDCDIRQCPVDGVWGDWGSWSGCDVTCGSGSRVRDRACEGQEFDGRNCSGPNAQREYNCSTDPCITLGVWFDWSSWGGCSVTCGGGIETRSRECSATLCGDDNADNADVTRPCRTFNCLPIAASCTEWKERGLDESTEMTIMQSDDVFSVRCNMTSDDGIGVTEITHNFVEPTRVSGYSGEGEYLASLVYSGSLEQVRQLVFYSAACSQSVSWRCSSGATIHQPTHPSMKMTYWTSGKSQDRYYWDGSHDADTDACACGLAGTCVRPELRCNCDADDGETHEDAGVITNKKDLPITRFNVGNTGGDRYGYFFVGPLRCSGKDPDFDY